MDYKMELLVSILGISCIIAVMWASKKRIGYAWGLFFLFFFSPIVGSLLIGMSPSVKAVSDSNKKGFYKFDKIISTFLAILAFGALANAFFGFIEYPLFIDNLKEKIYWYLFSIIALGGASLYFFTRSARHEKLNLR